MYMSSFRHQTYHFFSRSDRDRTMDGIELQWNIHLFCMYFPKPAVLTKMLRESVFNWLCTCHTNLGCTLDREVSLKTNFISWTLTIYAHDLAPCAHFSLEEYQHSNQHDRAMRPAKHQATAQRQLEDTSLHTSPQSRDPTCSIMPWQRHCGK